MAAELFQSHHGTSGKNKEDFWPWNVSLLLSCCSRMQINSWRSACGIVTWALCEIPVSTAPLEFGNLMNGKAILHLRPVNEKHLLVLSLSSFSEWFWSGFSIPALLGIPVFPWVLHRASTLQQHLWNLLQDENKGGEKKKELVGISTRGMGF